MQLILTAVMFCSNIIVALPRLERQHMHNQRGLALEAQSQLGIRYPKNLWRHGSHSSEGRNVGMNVPSIL